VGGLQCLESLPRIDGVRQRHQVRRHHFVHLGEAVDLGAVGRGDHADGSTVVHDHYGVVGAFGH
jgi:hypothetical protein